jgi:hypothetical protein
MSRFFLKEGQDKTVRQIIVSPAHKKTGPPAGEKISTHHLTVLTKVL